VKQRGFTILEIVVVLGLIVVVMLGLFALFTNHYKIYNYENALIKASGSARSTMTDISVDALQAYRVLQNSTINGTAYVSGPTTLIFQVPAFTSSGTAIANTYDYVAYSLTGTTLKEDFQAGSGSSRKTHSRTLSTSVSALTFTYDNATWNSVKKVTVDLTTQEVYKGETITQHLNQQFRLRNY
jgi:type II secretory pathway pseudopilin PulG